MNVNTEADFWLNVAKSDGCWNWTGTTRGKGYGKFGYGGKKQAAHRLAWEFTFGRIPEGMFVCHKCDNPPCCNPSHLFLGTAKDNAVDMSQKGRASKVGLKGEHSSSAKLTAAQVEQIRRLGDEGISGRSIARMFSVCHTNISAILRRKSWK